MSGAGAEGLESSSSSSSGGGGAARVSVGPTTRPDDGSDYDCNSDGDGDHDLDLDLGSAEDLALTPPRSPSPSGNNRSVIGDNEEDEGGPHSKPATGADGDADAGAGAVAEQQVQQQPVPYIKTLEEIYRVVDSLANSPVVDPRDVAAAGLTFHHHLDSDSDSDLSCDPDDASCFHDIPDAPYDRTCPACSTPYDRALDSLPFRSSLRLLYNDPRRQTWALGSRLLITEADAADDSQPGGPDVALAEATRMLKRSTQVPVPNLVAAWKDGAKGGRVVTVTEAAGGARLFDVWWALAAGARERVARQVAGYAEQWRWHYSDAISSVGGYPIVRGYEALLGLRGGGGGGGGGDGKGFPHCRSDIEFWGAIEERIRRRRRRGVGKEKGGKDRVVFEEAIGVLKEYMPESFPCVLTHGDLSTRNILVDMGDGTAGEEAKVAAILGFENAASLPVWAESVCARFCYCREDEQWKALLSRYLPQNPAALDWWHLWRAVRGDGEEAGGGGGGSGGGGKLENRARIRLLMDRCRRWPKPPKERRAFNTSRTEPGARQVPRREVAATDAVGDAQEERRAEDAPVAEQVVREEEGDIDASEDSTEDDVLQHEALEPSSGLSPGRKRSVFNPEPIRFSNPDEEDDRQDADEGDDGGDGGDGGGANSTVDDIEPVDLVLADIPESPSAQESDQDAQERQLDNDGEDPLGDLEQYGDDEDRSHQEEETIIDRTGLRAKRATWHLTRVTEGFEYGNSLEPDSTEMMYVPIKPHTSGRQKDTSPHKPAGASKDHVDTRDLDQRSRSRGRSRDRKRASMRSFAPQRTLQPFALPLSIKPTARRPQSLPVAPSASTISAADMERLRNVGSEGENTENPISESFDIVVAGEVPLNAGDALLPTIQEHPATPRTPVQLLSRVRPASLYGTLQAWGQSRTAAAGGSSSSSSSSGAHKRSRSEMVFNSPRSRRGTRLPHQSANDDSLLEARTPSPDLPPGHRRGGISWDNMARSRSQG